MNKKTLLFLRFILILVTILVMTYSKKGLSLFEPGYFVALFYFVSNIIMYRIPNKYFRKPVVSFGLFMFDIVVISVAVYLAQGIHTDFYLIYFLVIFIASVGQNIGGSIPTAIIASIFYGWLMYQSNPGLSFWDSKILIRIPFLFSISLISSYWSTTTRRDLRRKEELERFNKELQKEVARVAAEEIALRKYSEMIISSVQSGVLVVRNDGIITTLNPEAARSLGIESKQAVGKDIRDFPELVPLWQRIELCIGNSESVAREELVITTDEKKKVPLGYSLSYIGGAKDRFSGCVMIFKDLSGIRELESKLKRAERLSYLGKMASWVAHEIRNPLTAIDGFAQLLNNAKKQEKIKLFTAEIRKGTQRINYIIDDILAFARAKRKVAYVPINLKELVGSITESMSGTQIKIKGSDSPVVEGDYESVRRLFVNLINNSVEAMKGEGALSIVFGNEDEYVKVEMEDTGGGIPDEDIKNIFEPFFTTKQHGTGLGLSIVKKIVEEHQGMIEMTSSPGEGTTVSLCLPKKQKES